MKASPKPKSTLTAGKSETAPLPFLQRVSLPIITDDVQRGHHSLHLMKDHKRFTKKNRGPHLVSKNLQLISL